MTEGLRHTIGGFFELQLQAHSRRFECDLELNSARNALGLYLSSVQASKIHMPTLTCDCLYEKSVLGETEVAFYNVDEHYFPEKLPDLSEDEYYLYTDYFGVCSSHVKKLVSRYGKRLILDLSQSLFYRPSLDEIGACIYSPRKFFGLPDGGILSTNLQACHQMHRSLPEDRSSGRCSHLFKRLEQGPQAAYADFKANDASLIGLPFMRMSLLTRTLMDAANYEEMAKIRADNFASLHDKLAHLNKFRFGEIAQAPLAYPFRHPNAPDLRPILIDKQIFIPKYWPCVVDHPFASECEIDLVETTLPLPIDQRYGPNEMEIIAQNILNHV